MTTKLEAPEPAHDAAPATRVRVGIVDDTPDMRMLLRIMFERDERFEVVSEAGDGLEAVELVARLQPDLLVLDRQMPTLGGIEAPRTSVIVHTGCMTSGMHTRRC